MKFANLNEYKTAFAARTQTPEFKKNLREFILKAFNEIIDRPLKDWFDIAEKLPLSRKGEESYNKASEVVAREIRPLSQKLIVEKGNAVKVIVEADTLSAWRKVVTHPVDIPPHVIASITEQQAVKELLTTVVHDAIIGFNKKFNPAFGVLAAFGAEKQIKEFIIPFMDSAVKIATDFMNNPQNKPMLSDFMGKIYDIIVSQKPDILDSVISDTGEDEAWIAQHITSKDMKLRKLVHEHILNVIAELKKRNGSMSYREYLKKNKVTLAEPDITDSDIDDLARIINESEACAVFMFNELSAYS